MLKQIVVANFTKCRTALASPHVPSGFYQDYSWWRLSATSHKMYIQRQETEQDDHYSDFQSTLNFLLQEPAQQAIFRNRLQRYREKLFRLIDHGTAGLVNVKMELETSLRRVARTEKLTLKADRNGMLEVIPEELSLTLAELRHYLGQQRVARHLGHDDVLEYWKSASYLLNFPARRSRNQR